MKRILLTGAALALLGGCATAPPPKYDWGNYEQSMYGYYKNPSAPDALMLDIESTIKKAEAGKRSVGPGMYAEYGYLLMARGRHQEALAWFEKEKSRWPESAVLMDRMSKIALTQAPPKVEVKQ